MASPASLLGVLFHHGSERLDPGRQTEPIQADRNRNISKRTSMRGAPGLSGDRFSGTHSRKLARFAQASGAWLRSVRDTSPCPNSETLPTAVEVTSEVRVQEEAIRLQRGLLQRREEQVKVQANRIAELENMIGLRTSAVPSTRNQC